MQRDLLRRVLIDAAVLTVGIAAFSVRQPWLPPHLVSLFPGSASLLALGIVPFVTSFVVVEAVAFAVPAGRRWIRGGPRERERLWRIAVGLGLGVAALQAFAMAVALEKVDPGWSGPAFRGLVVAGFVAVTAGVAGASRIVDRYGLGGGFALFLMVGAGLAIWNWVAALARLDPLGALLPAVLLAAVVGFAVLRLTRPPYPAWGGLVPAAIAMAAGNVARASGAGWGMAVAGLVWLGASLAFARWLHPVDRVAALGSPGPLLFVARREAVRLGWGRAVGITLLLTGGVVVPALVVPGPLGSISPLMFSVALFVALIADLVEEGRARGEGWAPAWPLHQVWLVAPALEALATAGIPAHVRSVRYRALTGPFAPLAPMDVLVPEARVEEARNVLDQALRIDVVAVDRDTVPDDGGAAGAGAVD